MPGISNAERERRFQHVLILWSAGAPRRTILEKTGYPVATVDACIRRCKDEVAERIANKDMEIAQDLATLTAAIGRASAGHAGGDVGQGNLLTRLLERKARMLGLDSPARTEHTGKDGGPIEIAESIDMAALLANPATRKALETLGIALEESDDDAE